MKKNTQRRLTRVARTCSSLATTARLLEAVRSPMNPFSPEERAQLQREIQKRKTVYTEPEKQGKRQAAKYKEKAVAMLSRIARLSSSYYASVYKALEKHYFSQYPSIRPKVLKAIKGSIEYLPKSLGSVAKMNLDPKINIKHHLSLLSGLFGGDMATDIEDFHFRETETVKEALDLVLYIESGFRDEDFGSTIKSKMGNISSHARGLSAMANKGVNIRGNSSAQVVQDTLNQLTFKHNNAVVGQRPTQKTKIVPKKKSKKFMGLF